MICLFREAVIAFQRMPHLFTNLVMADPTVLDPQAIENLRALSPDTDNSFIRELIEIYLQDTPARISDLNKAIAESDAAAAVRAAHTIKGSSGNFGARQLVARALEIETQAKTGNLLSIAALIPSLNDEFAQVAAALKKIAESGN